MLRSSFHTPQVLTSIHVFPLLPCLPVLSSGGRPVTSPLTGLEMEDVVLKPNFVVKSLAADLMSRKPSL